MIVAHARSISASERLAAALSRAASAVPMALSAMMTCCRASSKRLWLNAAESRSPFQPSQLLAVKGRLGYQALHLSLGLVDDRRQTIALGPKPDRVENGDGVARLNAIADRYVERRDRPCGARGDLACPLCDQTPDHRHGLRHGLHAHLVDGDHGRRLLGCPLARARPEPERSGNGDRQSPKAVPRETVSPPALAH